MAVIKIALIFLLTYFFLLCLTCCLDKILNWVFCKPSLTKYTQEKDKETPPDVI